MSSGNTKQAVAEQKSKSDTDRVILIVNWFIILMSLILIMDCCTKQSW